MKSMLSAHDRVVVPRHVVIRNVEQVSVVLNTETGRYFTLDWVGTRIWAHVTASASIQDAYDGLLDEFDADPDELRGDVNRLIGDLTALQLLEIRHD